MVTQCGLHTHHIPHRHRREGHPVRSAGLRIEAHWAGAAVATTKDVRADDEETIGIDRTAGADEITPPGFRRGRLRLRMRASMRAAGEGMQYEHGIVARGRKRPPR